MNKEGSHFKVKSFCEKRHDNSKIASFEFEENVLPEYEQFSFICFLGKNTKDHFPSQYLISFLQNPCH